MEEEKQKPKEKRNISKIIKWLSIIVFILTIIVLIVIKIYYPSFQIKWIVIILIIVGILSILMFFSFQIPKLFNKNVKEDNFKNPKPITLQQAQLLATKIIGNNLCDYLCNIEDEGIEEHGRLVKQKIYFLLGTGLYSKQKYFIAINMHFPETNYRYCINPESPAKISYIKKRLATDPEESPNKEVIERENPLLGTKEKITKSIHKDEKKETEAKKEELS